MAISGTTLLVGSPDATVAGAASAGRAFVYLLDSTAPITTATGLHTSAGLWQRAAARVSLSATDEVGGSGLAASPTYCTVDGTKRAYAGPFTLGNGAHKVVYWSVDLAGNIETARVGYVNVDARAPTISAKALTVPAAKATKGHVITLRLTVVDPRPGCGRASVVLVVSAKGRDPFDAGERRAAD